MVVKKNASAFCLPAQGFASDFDLYFDAAGQFQFHQGIDGFRTAAVNIQQTLVRGQFELFARLLVDEGRTVDGEDFLVGGQGDGPGHHGSGHLYRLYDFLGGFVHQVVIVGLQFDSDSLLTHGFIVFTGNGPGPVRFGALRRLIYLLACFTTSAVMFAGASAWCEYSMVELARPEVKVRKAVT